MRQVTAGIYRITNVVNGKFYIGSSVYLASRRRGHFHHLRHGTHKNPHLQSAYNKYGEAAFRWDVISIIEDANTLIAAEQAAIDEMRPHYNICEVAGRPPMGRVVSEKTRQLISQANKGRKPTAEQRAKMSAAQAGRTHAAAARQKISLARRGTGNGMHGKRHTDEAIAKIAAASRARLDRPETQAALSLGRGWNKGVPFPEASRRKMSDAKPKRPVVRTDPSTGATVHYECASAAKSDGFHSSHIGQCCAGKRRLHKGYSWAFA